MDADVCKCNNILNLNQNDNDIIHNLKNKTVCEFMKLLLLVEKGKYPDYEFLMEEFNILDSCTNIDKSLFTLQFYLNNKWDVIY